WAGADLRITAATTLGMSLGVTVSAMATTPVSLITFNEIVHARAGDPIALRLKISHLIELGVIGGFAICLFGGLGAELMVHYLIGPVYDGYGKFLNVGAAVGFLFFPVSIAEIPLDGIRPPWQKAKLSLFMLMSTLLILFLLIHQGFLSPLEV